MEKPVQTMQLNRLQNGNANKMLPAKECNKELVKHLIDKGDCLTVAFLKSKFKGNFKRKKKKKNSGNEETDNLNVHFNSEPKDGMSVHMSFEEKLRNCRDFIFTEEEETYIYKKAEEYAMSVQPHKYYYIRPHSPECHIEGDPLYKAYLNGCRIQNSQAKQKRQRTDKCDYHFVTPGNPLRHPSLPIGTQVIRPKDTLPSLVYDAVRNSPHGLLQACHIYTALQNKYPYFTCLDSTAHESWKSSVRSVLHHKKFLRLKLNTASIRHKGCYWSLNPNYDPRLDRLQVEQTVKLAVRNQDLDAKAVEELQSIETRRDTQGDSENLVDAEVRAATRISESAILDPILTACVDGSGAEQPACMDLGLEYMMDRQHNTVVDCSFSIPSLPNDCIPDILNESSSQYEPDSFLSFDSLDYMNSTSFDVPVTDTDSSFCIEEFLQFDGTNSSKSIKEMDDLIEM